MVSDNTLAKDVEPRFQIYHQGRHLEDKDELLKQPTLAGGREVTPLTFLKISTLILSCFYLLVSRQVLVMKETLVFITPPQPYIEMIMQNVRFHFYCELIDIYLIYLYISVMYLICPGLEDQAGWLARLRQEYFKDKI